MRTDFFFKSGSGARLHGCRWTPDSQVRAVLQIVHGIAEYVERYDGFANFLNRQGILVVAEDHMGHGKSISQECPQGYFAGGWQTAVDDTYRLTRDTMAEFRDVPFILFGHSMGSFMARTILAKYPDSGITAAVICGTGWQPAPVLAAGKAACALVCRAKGERAPSPLLQAMAFGTYNRKVEHPRTPYDWLSRDNSVVNAYKADPLCGFTPTAGLMRDMMEGIAYIQREENLAKMGKALPVLFIAGGDDPVGSYGAGVRTAAEAFRKAGMERVDVRIYPLCRHELLNEINREEIMDDVSRWIDGVLEKIPATQV
ncbi:MAG: alpha/beta hydrolase [Clostridiales bacterium]|nr:alpha/beta hydrolase [Clostridiales bacterium]